MEDRMLTRTPSTGSSFWWVYGWGVVLFIWSGCISRGTGVILLWLIFLGDGGRSAIHRIHGALKTLLGGQFFNLWRISACQARIADIAAFFCSYFCPLLIILGFKGAVVVDVRLILELNVRWWGAQRCWENKRIPVAAHSSHTFTATFIAWLAAVCKSIWERGICEEEVIIKWTALLWERPLIGLWLVNNNDVSWFQLACMSSVPCVS